MTDKHLDARGRGETDYDYIEDVLFFKIKDREYEKSLELGNIVVDLDKEGFLVGIQMFDASKFLQIPKETLRDVKQWKFAALIADNIIEVRIVFEVIIRNRVVERSPIIIQQAPENLPNSEVVCATP